MIDPALARSSRARPGLRPEHQLLHVERHRKSVRHGDDRRLSRALRAARRRRRRQRQRCRTQAASRGCTSARTFTISTGSIRALSAERAARHERAGTAGREPSKGLPVTIDRTHSTSGSGIATDVGVSAVVGQWQAGSASTASAITSTWTRRGTHELRTRQSFRGGEFNDLPTMPVADVRVELPVDTRANASYNIGNLDGHHGIRPRLQRHVVPRRRRTAPRPHTASRRRPLHQGALGADRRRGLQLHRSLRRSMSACSARARISSGSVTSRSPCRCGSWRRIPEVATAFDTTQERDRVVSRRRRCEVRPRCRREVQRRAPACRRGAVNQPPVHERLHVPAVRSAGQEVRDEHHAAGPRHLEQPAGECGGDRRAQVIEQAGRVDEVELAGFTLPGENLADRSLAWTPNRA